MACWTEAYQKQPEALAEPLGAIVKVGDYKEGPRGHFKRLHMEMWFLKAAV